MNEVIVNPYKDSEVYNGDIEVVDHVSFKVSFLELKFSALLSLSLSLSLSFSLSQPLNTNPDSQWHKYFEDNDVLLQIDHDTRRLYPDMSFFQLPTSYPRKAFNTGTKKYINTLMCHLYMYPLLNLFIHFFSSTHPFFMQELYWV